MPTVFQEGQYTFIFFSSDRGEPPHIHVKHEHRIAKFWIAPTVLAKNKGFASHELNQIVHIIERNETRLLEAWHEYFDS
ncbi:MAG TPA: DUF4160 domain-containing protein [Anaerolineales bacterium]|jgi:Domain of unknown function (DUF4160)